MSNLRTIPRKDVRLGDVIRLSDAPINPYVDCTVIQIADGYITVFRPYVHTSDFACSVPSKHPGILRTDDAARLIPYIGFEKFDIPIDNPQPITIFTRRG